MKAAVMHGPGDVRFETVEDPKILKPTDAIIQLSATCICGSDLWPYRAKGSFDAPMYMGHEYCGVVIGIGTEVRNVRSGQFIVGSFVLSDKTCPHCQFGYPSSFEQREFMTGAQAPNARVPLAGGTLVFTQEMPPDEQIPHMPAVSDVLGTGYYAAVAAGVKEASITLVVGDGAVGLVGVLSAKLRGAEGIAEVLDLTNGVGADAVLECVGLQQSMDQALGVCRPDGSVGSAGVPHEVTFAGEGLSFQQKRRSADRPPWPLSAQFDGSRPEIRDRARQGL